MTHTAVETWRDPATQVRVDVTHLIAVIPVTDQYIEPARSVRLVWDYVRRVGPVAVVRKIRSRRAESRRNRKWALLGVGRVRESAGASCPVGTPVLFVAPNHSRSVNRVVIDQQLVVPMTGTCAAGPLMEGWPASLQDLVGWSPWSGTPLPSDVTTRLAVLAAGRLQGEVVVPPTHDPVERVGPLTPAATTRPTALVFGLGNYAKTLIVPHIRRHLTLSAVHEIDPDQLEAARGYGCALDTAPVPREGETAHAWFIAGYHHTHAGLAVTALTQGAYAVVEKPAATTAAQRDALEAATAAHPGRLFLCFHKRYARLHDWAHADLQLAARPAVDMHALVFEIPLPSRHWYEWPRSGGRLVSNGCHWLDYFLWVNPGSRVIDADARPQRGLDVLAWVTLDNGARLTLSLTDAGSARLGVREVIELRSGSTTVQIVDAADYHAETSRRRLRRGRVNPLEAYTRMYDDICRRVAAGAAADDAATLASTSLMLALDDEVRRYDATNVRTPR